MPYANIPEAKIKTDSGFYGPAARLVTAIKEYYKREYGIQISDKQLELQVLRIIRSQS